MRKCVKAISNAVNEVNLLILPIQFLEKEGEDFLQLIAKDERAAKSKQTIIDGLNKAKQEVSDNANKIIAEIDAEIAKLS